MQSVAILAQEHLHDYVTSSLLMNIGGIGSDDECLGDPQIEKQVAVTLICTPSPEIHNRRGVDIEAQSLFMPYSDSSTLIGTAVIVGIVVLLGA